MRLPPAILKLLYKAAAFPAEDAYTMECAKLDERRLGNVRVHGSEAFLADVTDALAQLQHNYPYGYSLVQRYVRGIIGSGTHRRTGHPIQVVFQPATAEGGLPIPPNRFAANLVRHAVVYRKQIGFGVDALSQITASVIEPRVARDEITSMRSEILPSPQQPHLES
jgi:hypothetical protein